MANDTDNFLKEVEEDLRREQVERLWERYGVYAIGVAVAVVLGVGGWKYFERQRTELNARGGGVYADASVLLDNGKGSDAMAKFIAVSQELSSGHGTLATLRLLGNEVRSGRHSNAVKHYDTLANNLTDPVLAGYARLQGALLKLDVADFTSIENHLRPLVQGNGPWRYLAREAVAVSAFRSKRIGAARQLLDQLIVDPLAPQAIKERARTLMVLITEGDIAATAAPKSESEKKPEAKPDLKPEPKVEPKTSSEAPVPQPAPQPVPQQGSGEPLPKGVVPPR